MRTLGDNVTTNDIGSTNLTNSVDTSVIRRHLMMTRCQRIMPDANSIPSYYHLSLNVFYLHCTVDNHFNFAPSEEAVQSAQKSTLYTVFILLEVALY